MESIVWVETRTKPPNEEITMVLQTGMRVEDSSGRPVGVVLETFWDVEEWVRVQSEDGSVRTYPSDQIFESW